MRQQAAHLLISDPHNFILARELLGLRQIISKDINIRILDSDLQDISSESVAQFISIAEHHR